MDSIMKKSSSLISLPRTSSTLSICSLPRTNSSCSLPRKGSLEDILNYSNFLEEQANGNEPPSTPIALNNNVNNEMIENKDINNLGMPRNPSFSSFLVDSFSSPYVQDMQQREDMQQAHITSPIRPIPLKEEVIQPTPIYHHHHQQPLPSMQVYPHDMIKEDTYEANKGVSPDDDNDDEMEEAEDEDGRKIVPTMPADAAGAKKVSYGSYGEFTIIEGIMYNNRGYEICGVLNQHNRPCQRIGKCPFHYKLKEKQAAEKKKKEAENQQAGIQNNSLQGSVQNIKIQNSMQQPQNADMEGKKPPPMKKTPYKQGWTKEEHFRFLTGLQIHGKGAWKDIAIIVGTRTPTQIQSHAQKYFLRQKQKVKNKRSIHDFTLDDLRKALHQNVLDGGSAPNSSPDHSPGSDGQEEPVAPPPRKEKKKKTKKEQAEQAPQQQQQQQQLQQQQQQQHIHSQQQQQQQQQQYPHHHHHHHQQQQMMQPMENMQQQQQQQQQQGNGPQNGDWSKNFAAIMAAMQSNAQPSGAGLNIAPSLAASYTMLGSLLMNNPNLLQAVQQQKEQYQQPMMQPTPYSVAPIVDVSNSYNSYLQNPFDYDQSPFDANKNMSRMQAQNGIQVPEPVFDYNATQLSSFENPNLNDILGNNAFDPLSSPTIPGYNNHNLAQVNVPNTALPLALPNNGNLKRKLHETNFEEVNPMKKRTIS